MKMNDFWTFAGPGLSPQRICSSLSSISCGDPERAILPLQEGLGTKMVPGISSWSFWSYWGPTQQCLIMTSAMTLVFLFGFAIRHSCTFTGNSDNDIARMWHSNISFTILPSFSRPDNFARFVAHSHTHTNKSMPCQTTCSAHTVEP